MRRASRKAFLWEEEAALMLTQKRSLTELPGVGVSLDRIIRKWILNPPSVPSPPEIRKGFLTLPEARVVLGRYSSLRAKGDLNAYCVERWLGINRRDGESRSRPRV
jgi:hypothetical protein